MPERFVTVDGVRLWTESFGDPGDPPILTLMGGTAQSILWPVDFLEGLAAAGRFVIRYDHRDTGLSDTFDFASHPYSIDDLTADAIGVMDAYGLPKAHLVGSSMGGMIAQKAALDYPDRVLSVTLISTSPGGAAVPQAVHGTATLDELGMPTPETVEAGMALVAAQTQTERVDAKVHLFRIIAGTIEPFDEAAERERQTYAEQRAPYPLREQNHAFAIASMPDRRPVLHEIDVPALVIHGTEDPVFPLDHGEALAAGIPSAELVIIDGMGHSVPRTMHAEIVKRIIEHTGS